MWFLKGNGKDKDKEKVVEKKQNDKKSGKKARNEGEDLLSFEFDDIDCTSNDNNVDMNEVDVGKFDDDEVKIE